MNSVKQQQQSFQPKSPILIKACIQVIKNPCGDGAKSSPGVFPTTAVCPKLKQLASQRRVESVGRRARKTGPLPSTLVCQVSQLPLHTRGVVVSTPACLWERVASCDVCAGPDSPGCLDHVCICTVGICVGGGVALRGESMLLGAAHVCVWVLIYTSHYSLLCLPVSIGLHHRHMMIT